MRPWGATIILSGHGFWRVEGLSGRLSDEVRAAAKDPDTFQTWREGRPFNFVRLIDRRGDDLVLEFMPLKVIQALGRRARPRLADQGLPGAVEAAVPHPVADMKTAPQETRRGGRAGGNGNGVRCRHRARAPPRLSAGSREHEHLGEPAEDDTSQKDST